MYLRVRDQNSCGGLHKYGEGIWLEDITVGVSLGVRKLDVPIGYGRCTCMLWYDTFVIKRRQILSEFGLFVCLRKLSLK